MLTRLSPLLRVDGGGVEFDRIEGDTLYIRQQAFKLDTTQAWEVMTPRVAIFAWPADRSLADIASELQTVRFSRVQVFIKRGTERSL